MSRYPRIFGSPAAKYQSRAAFAATGGTPTPTPTARAVTATGTYTGQASSFDLNLGFVPDLMFIKDLQGSTITFLPRLHSWVGRPYQLTNVSSLTLTGFWIIKPDGVVQVGVGDNAVNANGRPYAWFAYKAARNGDYRSTNWAGSPYDRVIDAFKTDSVWQVPPDAVVTKRDAAQTPIVMGGAGNSTKSILSGSAGVATGAINPDGTLSLGQGADLNIWSAGLGESCEALAFYNGSELKVINFTGDGTTDRDIVTGLDGLAFVMIFPRGSGATTGGATWFPSFTAGQAQGIASGDFTAIGTEAVKSVTGGTVRIGNSGRVNAAGTAYMMLAFRSQPNPALGFQEPTRTLRTTKKAVLTPGSYIDCGTSNTLQRTGAMTLEFFGSHTFTPSLANPNTAGANDNTATQYPLFWRSGGADQTAGSVSFGLMLHATAQRGPYMPLSVAVTDFIKLRDNGTYDADTYQPWWTGLAFPHNGAVPYMHYLVTTDGLGKFRIYINGRLVKLRDRDMTLIGKVNTTGFSGHRTTFGARQRGGANPEFSTFGLELRRATMWSRALANDGEAMAIYNSLFNEFSASVATDYTERWDVADATVGGSSVPAKVNAANNGTITVLLGTGSGVVAS